MCIYQDVRKMGPFTKESRKIGPFIYFLLKKGGQSYTWQRWKRRLFGTHIRTMPYIGSYPPPPPHPHEHMAHLPWMIRTRFKSPGNYSDNLRKQTFRAISVKFSFFFPENIRYVYHEYQHTIILEEDRKYFLNLSPFDPGLALWLTLSGSNYPCPEQICMVQNVRAIEVRLYMERAIHRKWPFLKDSGLSERKQWAEKELL